jgi:hypothetical protein
MSVVSITRSTRMDAIKIEEKSDMRDSPAFSRYIGIDYSGAQTAETSLPGLRMYLADRTSPPCEVQPPVSPRKYWTRRALAHRLGELLAEDTPTLIGIDHAFSFPLRYFEQHDLPFNWTAFLDDFQRHWPTDEEHLYVDVVRDGLHGHGAARWGKSTWRRLTEVRAGRAKSVFHFDVHGSVAKSTHSGLPWLRYLRSQLGPRIHFWPFDGWQIPAGRSAVAEVYPALWSKKIPREDRDQHQHDAYSIASWLRDADMNGALPAFTNLPLEDEMRKIAEIEGWILGVV